MKDQGSFNVGDLLIELYREYRLTPGHREKLAALVAIAEGALSREGINAEVQYERRLQDKKWGQQDHPSVYDDSVADREKLCRWLAIPTQAQAKATVERLAKNGGLTFSDIALEEFCEAVEAPGDFERRAELVQLAAVVQQWIEAIDRRGPVPSEDDMAEVIRGMSFAVGGMRAKRLADEGGGP